MVNTQLIIPSLMVLVIAVYGSVIQKRASGDSGTYTCDAPASGAASCGTRKQQILDAGATPYDLAITMEETNKPDPSIAMHAGPNDYYPYGDGKTGDSANFGIFKNNWLMMRTACSQFNSSGYGPDDYNSGAVLNDDSQDAAAITCLHETQSYYGLDGTPYGGNWIKVQRNGASGLDGSDTTGLSELEQGYTDVHNLIDPDHLSDDVLAYEDVTPK